ncbi:MAG: leucine-rich repeat domain-containing protein, partial [Lachnospiraceae bacterium]|nr:leucine-rich repeat domain-containing protein [Lachnospiraceae bacterium]
DTTTEQPASTEADSTTEASPSVGDVITVGNYVYKITSSNTVTLKGFAEDASVSKVIVKNKISYNGVSYKVTKIGVRAFKNESCIKQVIIRKNTVSIGQGAFNKCKKLTKVTIRTGVTTIGKNAFKNCSELKTINITSTVLTTVKANAFKNIKSGAVMNVMNTTVRNLLKSVVPSTITVNKM